MFINATNHKSENWCDTQRKQANILGGEIVDIPFPNIPADWSYQQVTECADKFARDIIATQPEAVLCQGEMVCVWHIVNTLKQAGIPVYAATTERCAQEIKEGDEVKKMSVFSFVGFRKY